MDLRFDIIESVKERLQHQLGDQELAFVQDILTIELNKYEIQERCTDIVVIDKSSESILKKYIATKRIEGLAEKTLIRYADENLKLIRFLNKPLDQITTYDLRFYLSYRRQQTGISNRTLDGMRRCYSSFFSWLTSEKYISHNPCSSLSRIKYKKQVKKPFSATDLEKLKLACNNIRDRALIEFLYSSGCRVSEVVNLDVCDVDFGAGECKVVGKGNKERIVYLSSVAMMYLKKYLNERKYNGNALFHGRNQRLSKQGIEAAMRRLGECAGVKNVHPHRFRRTLATNLLDRGMNIQDVAEILGHADLKTTQIYCFISRSNVSAAYRKYAA